MDIYDLLLAPFYLIFVFLLAYKYKAKHQHEHAAYNYFLPGLLVKIIGGISLGLVYFYYYGGGDTVNYFNTGCAFVDLFNANKSDFIHIYFGTPFPSEYYLLKGNTDFIYWMYDPYAFFVSKCFFIFIFLGAKSYVASVILVAAVCYFPIWKLYLVFVTEIPELYKQFAYSILFVPSVVFWGSGIMKDSITFSAVCLYVFGFYWLAINKHYTLLNVFAIFIAGYLLLSIKPYIFIALMPGSVIWMVAVKVKNIKNALVKIMLAPTIIILGTVIIVIVINSLGSSLGKYSIDKVFDTAHVSNHDLKQSYYKGNTFDIGDYDASAIGLMSVSHKAIFATLFRPTILDVRNVIMLFSALENSFLLFFCLYLLIKLKVFKFITLIRSHPLALFSLIFSLFFAISVGVSISNFGTLVRLKIPCIPFFISSLIIINYIMKTRLKI